LSFLNFISKFNLSFMSNFISKMKFFNCICQIIFTGLMLLNNLQMANFQITISNVSLFKFIFQNSQFFFELLYSFFTFFCKLVASNYSFLELLVIMIQLIQLNYKISTSFFIRKLKLSCFFKFYCQMLFFTSESTIYTQQYIRF